MRTVAVFDIGSNTVLVTVGSGSPTEPMRILLDEGDVARLSEGLQDNGLLQESAKRRVLEALQRFKIQADATGATEFLAAGTAAFRRARDGREFAQRIQSELNIPVKILSGEEEAHYSYRSACLDFEKQFGPLGMIDIGGGSTEFVFGEKEPHFSLPLGTVRLTEKFIRSHPISDAEWERVKNEIEKILKTNLIEPSLMPNNWVAVAATPASLASVILALPIYQPEIIHGFHLSRSSLANLVETLRQKSLPERIAMPGMHPKRAELLPVGGLILLEAMKFFNIFDILVSDHGLRYGLLAERLEKN